MANFGVFRFATINCAVFEVLNMIGSLKMHYAIRSYCVIYKCKHQDYAYVANFAEHKDHPLDSFHAT